MIARGRGGRIIKASAVNGIQRKCYRFVILSVFIGVTSLPLWLNATAYGASAVAVRSLTKGPSINRIYVLLSIDRLSGYGFRTRSI